MGREVRRVPPGWNHPQTERSWGRVDYQPMRDERFEDAVREWKEGQAKWDSGLRPEWQDGGGYKWVPKAEWCSNDIYGPETTWDYYHGDCPDDPEYYRPWADEEAVWYQVWETVSEGTPVTPPFATPEELVDYLVTNGDFWDQNRRREGRSGMPCDPWSRAAAVSFVGTGWAPSMIVTRDESGGVEVKQPRDGIV